MIWLTLKSLIYPQLCHVHCILRVSINKAHICTEKWILLRKAEYSLDNPLWPSWLVHCGAWMTVSNSCICYITSTKAGTALLLGHKFNEEDHVGRFGMLCKYLFCLFINHSWCLSKVFAMETQKEKTKHMYKRMAHLGYWCLLCMRNYWQVMLNAWNVCDHYDTNGINVLHSCKYIEVYKIVSLCPDRFLQIYQLKFCGVGTMLQTHPVFNSVKILYSTFISLMHSSLCASMPLALLHPSSFSVPYLFLVKQYL